MKTIILYYSRSGTTRVLADKKATELGADIEEILDIKKPSIFSAIIKALKRAKTEIQPIKAQLDIYEKIVIMSPVWAGSPVPAVNSVIDCLPSGKKIEFIMVSMGGGTKDSAARTKEFATARGCEITGYTDLKAVRKKNEVSSEVLN